MKIKTQIQDMGFMPILFTLSLCLIGGFHEYISCFVGALLSIWIIIKVKKEKNFRFRINHTSVALIILTCSYLLSSLWAVDIGMAFLGFLKFLPIILFILGLFQDKEAEKKIEHILPCVASVMTVISFAFMYIPVVKEYFNVAGRMAGFFQYPNTFAIFLLVAELLIISKEERKRIEYLYLALIVVGLLMTGSRTVFALAIVSNIVYVLNQKNRRIKVVGLSVVAVVIVGVVLIALLVGESSGISRLIQVSFSETTFVGRILYFVDALPLILRHPFGLGYMGYYYIQGSIQTGVYSVMFIHNDFLQILLDVGWVPFIVFVIAIVRTFVNKKVEWKNKLILSVLILHSMFDFNLQFVSMFFLFVLFLDYESGKEIVYRKSQMGLKIGMTAIAAVCLWCGIALFLSYLGKFDVANKIYPWNTQNQMKILAMTEDVEMADRMADDILKRNKFIPTAYSAKAKVAYSQGDLGKVMEYKRALFQTAPFMYEEYEDYCYMLMKSIPKYRQAGDAESAEICEQELLQVYRAVASQEERLSELGKKIKDQPNIEMPKEIEEYVAILEKTYNGGF